MQKNGRLGYIFQMIKINKTGKIIVLLGLGFLFSMFLINEGFAKDPYGYKRPDKNEALKKYTQKLNEDKKKVELAIINTRSLIKIRLRVSVNIN